MRETFHRTLALTACLAAILTMLPGAAGAAPGQAPQGIIHAGAVGEAAIAPDGSTVAERLRLRPDLAARLLELSQGGSVLLSDWPTVAGERGSVELTRFDVYAPDARIVEVRGSALVEVPRSRLAFFRGLVAEDASERLLVSVDPDSGRLAGYTARGGELSALRAEAGGDTYLLAPTKSFLPPGEKPDWSCAQETSELDRVLLPATAPHLVPQTITSLHTATVAVDTDNELMNLKFANNGSAATNYIANLFAAMDVIYERDLLIRLLQGFTILRPSTTLDPYVQPCGAAVTNCSSSAASGAMLNELSGYWAGGCGGACTSVARATVMFLSGKQNGNSSASGIAWLNSLCSTGTGYSVNQVFKFAQDTSFIDIMVTAHEIGHNFGSPHTHCYNPPIDHCFNTEGGCYSGAPSCPAPATYNGVTNVTGTLMSYCHLSGLGGCGSSAVFHPTTVNLFNPIVQSKVGICIFPLGPPTGIFSNGFETGLAPPWSGKVP